ncbi:MAG: IS1380 family transposase [Actinobacteria bacterium]|nr:IS1380 family transposase [Actinomycetota bacterium]MCA1698301.1 IS1380 family transposase [Actinomycetota bacterium]
MVQDDEPVGLDGLQVKFDDERVVCDAGVALVATLAGRLGVEALAQRLVRLRAGRPGGSQAGRKVMALIYAMLLGADSIDDCELLRAGRTRRLLGGWMPAPSTLGTFLRAFTFGHVRQLDRLLAQALGRAWKAGAGPGTGRLTVDVDSFIGEVHGHAKQGAAFGYTRKRGYHPIVASRAETGEVLHVRLRKGSANTSRGMLRFCDELIARVRRAGAAGPVLLRADSGFWSGKVFARLARAGWQFSIGVRMQPHVRATIEQIDEAVWRTLQDYPPTSIAQIAETSLGEYRLIVRRVRTLNAQGELLPSWEHFPLATNRSEPTELVEAEHRQHAVVELVIRDLKDQALAHFPSGHFHANGAWTVIACLAHNLLRWTEVIGLGARVVRNARTLRRRLLAIPGRLTRHAGRWILHLPARWPWQQGFIEALTRIRALPAAA